MGYDMYYRDGTGHDGDGYFGLNVWGMRWCRDEMACKGMIFDAGSLPDWPDCPDDFDPYARKYPEDYPDGKLTAEQEARADAYFAQLDEVLSWHGPEMPGIPGHKFSSNDGWIVLPAECEAAVRLADDHVPAEYPDLWRDWIAFMRRSARHGGFEVH